jgi:hypothetical protein
MRAWLLLLVVVCLVSLVWLSGWRPLDRFNPWAPLNLRASADIFFRYKLQRLDAEPGQCPAALASAGAVFTSVPDRQEADGCGWKGAVRLSGVDGVRLASPVVLSCPLAASLTVWTRRVLQPSAGLAFGSPVVMIDHVGSYACRNVYHREQAPLSHHATADALDMTGVRLADGRRITVARDWASPGAGGTFLHAVHDDGCRYFGGLLGPDYNAAHHDHFHLQGGGFGFCR